jgi:uncharacterized SAM-binding protein YcdF (DUF218 family)
MLDPTMRRFGLFLLSCLALLACASTAGSELLVRAWERLSPRPSVLPARSNQAIVVITGRDTRLAHAAALARASQLPVYIGGDDAAFYFAGTFVRRYGIAPHWKENGSRDTEENAAAAACILLPQGIRSIALVTDRLHMPRAVLWFRRYGFQVTETPSPLPPALDRKPLGSADLLPSVSGLSRLRQLGHEVGGLAVYAWAHEAGTRQPCGPAQDAHVLAASGPRRTG